MCQPDEFMAEGAFDLGKPWFGVQLLDQDTCSFVEVTVLYLEPRKVSSGFLINRAPEFYLFISFSQTRGS